MHSLAIDIDHTLQELKGSVPRWWTDPRAQRCGEEETPAEFRLRMATLKAIRVLEEIERQARAEKEADEPHLQAALAFACRG
jgi:hypothetical protein